MALTFSIRHEEHGYTLVETLISVTLLVSVLIPLGVMMGNFLLDRHPGDSQLGLRLAQTEMSRILSESDFTSGSKSESGMVIERQVNRERNVVRITVTVSSARDTENHSCVLYRTILLRE